ncbi:helix-turn-helix transcriptional regulator [Lentzea sp. BCCO 10_0856]|uniref:Helix-turn-helix transcriptional regulator n=1 Tax=Lentzea miocenica TaxID=3095431 RepID=A0ABU4TAN0_9PSEU|nr:helix-turn-helix transcriptional regulator [Lentzea sp. BCCO 10_0856]MDX8035226.1 helix-turn-helix transcriptional regulator [Lentzea sp. BCCO 10_0856]
MEESAERIGARVRYWRERRKLPRRQFADMVGRSVSWLDKIESGERELARLPVIERVADALSIDPAVLTDNNRDQRTRQCVDASEVLAIRAALATYPGLSPDAHVTIDLARLTRQASYLDHAWAMSRFTVVARNLPSLMADAYVATQAASDAGLVATRRILVTANRLASSMLLKFESNDLAWLAADRAMHTAMGIDDTWSLARATRSVARAMTSIHQHPQAIVTLVAMADRMRGEVRANPAELLALQGMLYLAASITAAGQEDRALADGMHEAAIDAAQRFEPHHDDHHTCFGVANTLIHRVSALVRLHECGQALEFAKTISPWAVATLSVERQSNYLLDLTKAHISVGNYRQAARMLGKAEQTAPEEVRCRPLAHGLLRSLLNTTTGEPARLVRQMAGRAGVEA